MSVEAAMATEPGAGKPLAQRRKNTGQLPLPATAAMLASSKQTWNRRSKRRVALKRLTFPLCTISSRTFPQT